MVVEGRITPQPEQALRGGNQRWSTLALGGLLGLHGILCWLGRPAGFLTGQDDVEYAVLGQSLRHGGYNMLFRVDSPVHAQYPPGYPAMLGVWGAVFGDGFDALALMNIVLSMVLIAVTWSAARRMLGEGAALATAAVLAISPALVIAGGLVATETPYALLAMTTLVLLMSDDRRARALGVAAAAAILAALTRSIGMVLLAAVALHWLLERRWKALGVFALACTLTVGAWVLWTVIAAKMNADPAYLQDLRQVAGRPGSRLPSVARRVSSHVTYYITRGVPSALAMPTLRGTIADNIASVLLLGVGSVAGLLVFLRRWRVAGLYILIYAGLLGAWVWRSDRFLVPLVPVLVVLQFAGWSAIAVRMGPKWRAPVIAAVATLLLMGGATRTAARVDANRGCHGWVRVPPAACVNADQLSYFEALAWIRENVDPDDVFLVAKSGALWAYTGARSISYAKARAQADDTFLPYLKQAGVKWIVLSHLERAEEGRLLRLLERSCSALRLESYFPERTYLFRVVEPEFNEGEATACQAVQNYRVATADNDDGAGR